MKFQRTLISTAVVSTLAVMTSAVTAQTPAPTPPPAAPARVERVEVTGSNIKRTDAETASPIQVITREQIEKSGATTITELLQRVPSSNAGSLSEIGSSASFAPGASSVSLRGLGSSATLVLLNGRRMATYGFANGAQTTFVNVDSIPTTIVDRIEVLKDGASAIYGSEAMAGVINIILRKDYKGAELTASTSIQDRYWDLQATRVSATLGGGDIARDKWNGFINVDLFKRDSVSLLDRADKIDPRVTAVYGINGGRSSFGYPGNYEFLPGSPNIVGGATLRPLPGCAAENIIGGVCRYNQWADIQLINPSERGSVFGRFTYELSPTLTAFSELSFNQAKTTYAGPPNRSPSFRVDPTFDWLRSTDSATRSFEAIVLPVGHPQNPYNEPVSIRYRFADRGPVTTDVKSQEIRGLAGLKGQAGTWDWEAGLLYLRSDSKATYNNQIHYDNLITAIDNRSFVFGGPNTAAVLDSVYKNLRNRGLTTTAGLDLKANTEIGRLPGGAIGVAVGAEYRRESFQTIADPLFINGNIVNYGSNSVDGSRNVISTFAEASLPVIKNLELSTAVRWDRYSDAGNSVTPKVGFKFTPLKEVVLRGTYAEGFRAPALTEISRSYTSFFLNGITDPARCAVTNEDQDCNGSIAGIAAPNPNVKPETSKSFTVGLVIEPTTDLNFSVDYYNIKRRNEIGLIDYTFLLANEALFPGRIIRAPRSPDDPAGIPGQLRSISLEYQNLGRTLTSGVDFQFGWKAGLGEWGKLSGTATVAHTLTYKASPTSADEVVNYNGSYNQPRTRATNEIDWERGPWLIGVRTNTTSPFSYAGASGGSCLPALTSRGLCKVGEYTTTDLFTRYSGFKNVTLSARVNNVTDKFPPVDVRGLSNQYNRTYHGLGGRFFGVGARYEFK
jgi:iron complex outermembrane recepter protein